MPGVLYLVATPIGNLEDMSFRAVRVLGEVDVIAAEDTRSARRLLTHFDIHGPRVVSLFAGNEAERSGQLLDHLAEERAVAIISEAGMPGISDPGHRVVVAAIDAGVRVEVIPGPVAAMTALVGSGLATDRFEFIGFPPRAAGARQTLFGSVRKSAATLLFYEAPDRVGTTLADLRDALGGDRRAVLARELTKKFEEQVRGTLAELAELFAVAPPRGECTLVVEGQATPVGEDPLDVEAAMRELLASGLGPKDAAARLMVTSGKPRRQLYQLALSLKREPGGR